VEASREPSSWQLTRSLGRVESRRVVAHLPERGCEVGGAPAPVSPAIGGSRTIASRARASPRDSDERTVECGHRFVPHIVRDDLRRALRMLVQELPREVHAPATKIRKRRLTDHRPKPRGEHGPRDACAPRQRLDCPRVRGLGVHGTDRALDGRVREGRQPSSWE
jgi:hypothetical protein